MEREFGSIKIIDTFPDYDGFKQIEDFLSLPGIFCVISELLALMGNLTIGDYIYIRATDQEILEQKWDIPDTWTLFQIVAIIEDQGESFQDFDQSIENSLGLKHPSLAIYCSLNLTQQYIFNSYEQKNSVSYIMIQNEFGQEIDQTIQNLYRNFALIPGVNQIEWYGLNLQESYLQFYLRLIDLFTVLFYAIGVITLMLCSLLI
ncbi:hypothetical protein ES708_34473 [subsurface metagenome]